MCGVGGARVLVLTYSWGIYGLFKTASWSQQGYGRRHCVEANVVLTRRGQGGSEGPAVAGRTCWVCGMEAGHSPSRVLVPVTVPEKSPGEGSRNEPPASADSGVRGSRAPEATSGDTAVHPLLPRSGHFHRAGRRRSVVRGTGQNQAAGIRMHSDTACELGELIWNLRGPL